MQACCSLEEAAADHHRVGRAGTRTSCHSTGPSIPTRTHVARRKAGWRAVAPLHAEEVS